MLLERYRCYLVGGRGLGAATARGYVDLVRPFVAGRATTDGVDVGGLSGADVVGFVQTVSGERTPKTAQRTVSALRSLLRFCHVQGLLGLRWPRRSRRWPTGGPPCLVSWNPPRWRRCWARLIAATSLGVVISR